MTETQQLAATFDIEATNLDPMFGIVLCVCVKPWGQPTKTFRLTDYTPRKRISSDDSGIVEAVNKELNKYAILIAHFGTLYDRKFLNGRALKHGVELLNPKAKMIDPWRVAKTHLNFKSNSLDSIAHFLGCIEEKTRLSGQVWMDAAINRDKECFEYIVTHCEKDVDVLEEVAAKLVPFLGNITAWGSA